MEIFLLSWLEIINLLSRATNDRFDERIAQLLLFLIIVARKCRNLCNMWTLIKLLKKLNQQMWNAPFSRRDFMQSKSDFYLTFCNGNSPRTSNCQAATMSAAMELCAPCNISHAVLMQFASNKSRSAHRKMNSNQNANRFEKSRSGSRETWFQARPCLRTT